MADVTPGPLAGKDCKLYYNSGTHASPTWVLVARAQNVQIPDLGVNPVAANSRESNFEANVPGLIKSGFTFTYLHVRGTDSVRDAMLAMVTGRTSKEFAIMDGDITHVGARGLRLFGLMEKFGYGQELESSQSWDASVKPAYQIESSAKVEPDILIVAGA